MHAWICLTAIPFAPVANLIPHAPASTAWPVATAVVAAAVVVVATVAAEVVAAGLVVVAEAVVAALSVADPSLIPKNRARFCGLYFFCPARVAGPLIWCGILLKQGP